MKTHTVPVKQGGKTVLRAVPVELSRFDTKELRRLRAERGVGSTARIDAAVRERFVPTEGANESWRAFLRRR